MNTYTRTRAVALALAVCASGFAAACGGGTFAPSDSDPADAASSTSSSSSGASSSSSSGSSGTSSGSSSGNPQPATYSVGGMVTGLTGTGLVLRNNAGDDLPIAADGTFTFPTKLAAQAAFAVTVTTQPSAPAQTCTVSGGTGTVVAGDVTSITVNCATNGFAIGGTVSGLVGSGLTLTNNAGDPITVNDNGTFAFPTTLTPGAAYAVAVSVQPSDPTQTCVVTDGSGTVADAAVSTIAITCTTSTFTIGGRVSGLLGTGLLLKNNGGSLSVAADGDFVFPVPVESGATFEVQISEYPTNPAQTCVVTGGSGRVGSSNVTDVAVTCTTNTYTVGGTLAGLVGSVTLAVNGGDDLVLAANGDFAFATEVASGAAYAVTVKTQPATVRCEVASGAGTVGSAPITNVTVTCSPGLTKWSEGTMDWPDQACNSNNSFGGCNTNAASAANSWATFVCQKNGWSTGVWTGNKAPGCNGPVSMFCGGGDNPCIPVYEMQCAEGDQTKVEIRCEY